MKYSVIIPVYKAEKFLENTVQSVLQQTYKDFEVVLVDDGSPDNSPAICDELARKDERIKVIHKQNGGVSSARNEGIRQAQGDYVFFLDSDDTFDKRLFEVCLPYTEKNVKVVYFSYKEIYADHEQIIAPSVKYVNFNSTSNRFKVLSEFMWTDKHFNGKPTMGCHNRKFLIENDLFFNEKYVLSEDVLYNLFLYLYLDEYLTVDFIGYFYNRTNENSSCHINKTNLNEFSLMSFDTYNELKEKKLDLAISNYGFFHYFIIYAGNWWVKEIKNTKDVKKYYKDFTVSVKKDFYDTYMKKSLKYKIIKYNEFRPLNYIQEKCYRALNIYAINQNKFALKLRCFFIDFTFPFVRLNAKIKRRLKGLFKKNKND